MSDSYFLSVLDISTEHNIRDQLAESMRAAQESAKVKETLRVRVRVRVRWEPLVLGFINLFSSFILTKINATE